MSRLKCSVGLSLALMIASFVFLPLQVSAQTTQPNVLVIYVDDLRGDAPSIEGDPDYAFSNTPNIDRIAQEGARFSESFVVHSLCGPARATLLTGLYSHQHGVIGNSYGLYGAGPDYLSPDMPNLATILGDAGYETAWIGKWHLGALRDHTEFDYYVSFPGQGVYKNPRLLVEGQVVDYPGRHVTEVLTDHLVDFVSRERTQPFFAVVSHKAVHAAATPPDHLRGIYDNDVITPPPTWNEDISDKPAWYQECVSRRPLPTEYDETEVRRYFSTLQGVDEAVGRMLAALEAQGVLDDTVVIFTGDNGYFLGEHYQSDKRLAYEESMRVPLYVRYPDWFNPGTLIDRDMALNIDLAPTILAAAGVDHAQFDMPGQPLAQLGNPVPRKAMLYEYFKDGAQATSCIPTMRALRRQNYKYIAYYNDGTTTEAPFAEELYNLNQDPIEDHNLVNDPAMESILISMRKALANIRGDFGDDTNTFPAP